MASPHFPSATKVSPSRRQPAAVGAISRLFRAFSWADPKDFERRSFPPEAHVPPRDADLVVARQLRLGRGERLLHLRVGDLAERAPDARADHVLVADGVKRLNRGEPPRAIHDRDRGVDRIPSFE